MNAVIRIFLVGVVALTYITLGFEIAVITGISLLILEPTSKE